MDSTTAAHVLEVLKDVEQDPGETPAQLRARAEAIGDDFRTAVAALPRLGLEMAELRARATAIEARDAAREPVREAEAGVAGAEASLAATAQPEEDAAGRATRARHLFEQARDAWEQGVAANAEPAELVSLDQAAASAARVNQHEQRSLASAQAARESARRALDTARATLARAQADLEKAEAAIAAPMTADRPLDERFAALLLTWPVRVAMRSVPGWELDPGDMAICRELCASVADDLNVVPARRAREIREAATEEATRALRRMRISVPGTALDTTVGALLGNAG